MILVANFNDKMLKCLYINPELKADSKLLPPILIIIFFPLIAKRQARNLIIGLVEIT